MTALRIETSRAAAEAAHYAAKAIYCAVKAGEIYARMTIRAMRKEGG